MKTNKEIVIEFYDKVFNNWDLSVVDDYVREDYRQHSPEVRNGREGFKEFIAMFVSNHPRAEIYKILEDGDMVCVFFKCSMDHGVVAKVFDMYRLEGGMLVEHWDCTMRVDGMECPHDNGQF